MSQLTAEELTALKSKAKDVRIDILKIVLSFKVMRL